MRRNFLWLLLLAGPAACSPPVGPVLDRQALLERQGWWDNRDWAWYKANIPFFESPDSDVDATYYYRWELLTKHLTYGSPETGYSFTEFIDRPFWSGAYGSISCPLGHQLYEARWLRDRRYAQDYAAYWFTAKGAEPRSYSNWYGDAVWAVYLVQGDSGFLRRMLPHMEAQVAGWNAEHWDAAHRMFHWSGMHDGMEFNIDSRQTPDSFAGADGYRPTLNSYLFADETAIARAAALFGDSIKAKSWATRAAALKRRVQEELWDSTRHFFFHQFVRDEAGGIKAKSLTYQTGRYRGSPHGRELIGYVPWQFNLPDSGYEAAWRYLKDTTAFAAPRGPTTAERSDPLYYVSPRCCWWSGNEWPYATTQTLVALANLLNNYHQTVVTKADYFQLLKTYTLDQRLGGAGSRPYIAESADPVTGSWEGANSYDHSEHYFHSGFVDLIITGLVGLRPRADDTLEVNPLAPPDWPYFALDEVQYHGHRVTVVWDRDGEHFRRGRGLILFVDGRRVAHAPELRRLTAPLGRTGRLAPVDRAVNLAVNNGPGLYPLITASYSAPTTPPFYANDGNYWYHTSPPNRWTAAGSGHGTDWIAVDFGVPRPVEQLKLYFLDDSAEIRAPLRYDVQTWNGLTWISVPRQRRTPAKPEGHRANLVSFGRITTRRLRVVLTHHPHASSGLTELEAWAHTPLPLPHPTAQVHDVAYNGTGRGFPHASASFTAKDDRVEEVNDGRIAFTGASRNRWTAFGSPHQSDWVEIAFGGRKTVQLVELFLWGDSAGVKAPKRFTIQYWDGTAWAAPHELSRLPAAPAIWAVNTVRIEPVKTDKIRVVFEHDLPARSGMTEIRIWEVVP